MSTLKVIIGFSDLRDDDLDIQAAKILLDLTGIINYTTPVPDLATVQVSLSAYENALTSAQNGGAEKTAIKDKARKELETLLKQLGTYVQLNCKNDLSILLSSGFDANKSSSPVGMLPKPTNLKIENGPNIGSTKITLDKIKGASSYLFEYATAPLTAATNWIVKVGTTRTFIDEGLTSGQQYVYRVAGIGADPTIVYSDVVSKFVQ